MAAALPPAAAGLETCSSATDTRPSPALYSRATCQKNHIPGVQAVVRFARGLTADAARVAGADGRAQGVMVANSGPREVVVVAELVQVIAAVP